MLHTSNEERRDVLAIRSLDNVKRFYIRAIALVFRSTDGIQAQVAFVIDGKLSSEHELAFAGTDGMKRLTGSLPSEPAEPQELAAATQLQQSGSESCDRAIHAASTAAEVAAAEAAHALEVADSSTDRETLRERLRTTQAELERLREEAARLQVRNLYVLDHPPLFDDALSNAKERLMIISAWVRAEVVTHDVLRKLESLLCNGVQVYIGYGFGKEEKTRARAKDIAVVDQLQKMQEKHPNLRFVRLGNTHAKVLIKDREFAAVTSFNWLSCKGDPNRTFRDEQGTLYQTPELVEQKFSELVTRFHASTVA